MNAAVKPEHAISPADLARAQWVLPDGSCPRCNKAILKGNVLLTRVVVLGAKHSTAKCTQCKALVNVPVALTGK